MASAYTTITPGNRPDYRDTISYVSEAVWPEFMLHDPVANQHWDGLFDHFPAYQFALLDPEHNLAAAIANSVPLRWEADLTDLPDDGWDWALIESAAQHTQGIEPNLLCGLQIAIAPDYQRRGLSRVMLEAMLELAAASGLSRVVIPVRPSMKDRYPLTPIERYIHWKGDDGLPFDAWLRVHVRSGGQIVQACPQAMTIPGTIAEWQEWTGMRFPESGEYVVPGALVPVRFDVEADRGEYIEPNVWVLHNTPRTPPG